jgi:hypothetical protein
MAADAALESVRSLICALDIIFAVISLSSLYVPLFWRSWTYEKGIIIRRDLWIARFIVLSSRTASSDRSSPSPASLGIHSDRLCF